MRPRREDPLLLCDVLLHDVRLQRPVERRRVDALTLRGREEERERDDGGATDRHRGRDVAERDPIEQGLEVVEGVGGDAAAADLALAPRVVGVQPHQRGHVEGHREPRLPVVDQEPVARVRLGRRAVAGELAHRPDPAAVHARVGAARERIDAGLPELRVGIPVVEVVGTDDRRNGSPDRERWDRSLHGAGIVRSSPFEDTGRCGTRRDARGPGRWGVLACGPWASEPSRWMGCTRGGAGCSKPLATIGWFAVRVLAFCFGACLAVNVVGAIRHPGFDPNLWWVDLRSIPWWGRQLMPAAMGVVLLSYGLRPGMDERRRVVSLVVVGCGIAVALADAIRYYALWREGTVGGASVRARVPGGRRHAGAVRVGDAATAPGAAGSSPSAIAGTVSARRRACGRRLRSRGLSTMTRPARARDTSP